MNNIVSFTRPNDLVTRPAAAMAVAQLIVVNGLGPEEVWHAVQVFSESLETGDDEP